jgi:hypothetical protein
MCVAIGVMGRVDQEKGHLDGIAGSVGVFYFDYVSAISLYFYFMLLFAHFVCFFFYRWGGRGGCALEVGSCCWGIALGMMWGGWGVGGVVGGDDGFGI